MQITSQASDFQLLLGRRSTGDDNIVDEQGLGGVSHARRNDEGVRIIRTEGSSADIDEIGISVQSARYKGGPITGIPDDRDCSGSGGSVPEDGPVHKGQIHHVFSGRLSGDAQALFGVEVSPGIHLEG